MIISLAILQRVSAEPIFWQFLIGRWRYADGPILLYPNCSFVINIISCAGVVEWQTRRTQNPVGVTP
jgi:hypothetical protein